MHGVLSTVAIWPRSAIGLSRSRLFTLPVSLVRGIGGRSADGGDSSAPTNDDLLEINNEIAAYVGPLGSPDFEEDSPQAVEWFQGGQPPTRLAVADVPSAAGAVRFEGEGDRPTRRIRYAPDGGVAELYGWSSGLSHATDGDIERESHTSFTQNMGETRRKRVLILNGASCFLGGHLATTGETEESVMEAIHISARELELDVKVFTSNHELSHLDELEAERRGQGEGYDAVLYNPACFEQGGLCGSYLVGGSNYNGSHGLLLERALTLLRCPVVRVLPLRYTDPSQPSSSCWCCCCSPAHPSPGRGQELGESEGVGGRSGDYLVGSKNNGTGMGLGKKAVIAGLGGAASYSLALRAVTGLMPGDRKPHK